MALYRHEFTGKSRVPFWEPEAAYRTGWIKLPRIGANGTFNLPANVSLTGKIVIRNNSGNTQAAITVGTAPAGTQVSAGSTLATQLTRVDTGTRLQPTAADRTIYVESAAWQVGVHVMFEVEEYAPVADTSALS